MSHRSASAGPVRGIARFTGMRVPAEVRAAGSRVLRETVRESPLTVAMLCATVVVGTLTSILTPAAVASAIDAAGGRGDLRWALAQLGAVLAVATATDVLDGLIGSYYGSNVTARLRHRLVGDALRLGLPGQQRFPSGDLVSRVTANAGSPATFLPLLLSTGATVLTAVGAVVALAWIDLRLAAAFLLGVPLAVVLLRFFVSRAGGPFVRYQEFLAGIMTRLLDAHRGVRTIRASGTFDREVGRILEPLPELHGTGRQVWEAQRRASWQLSLLVPILQVLVLGVGGYALTAGSITAAQLAAAAFYVGLALGAVGLLDTLVSLMTCQVGAGRVGEVLEAKAAVPPPWPPVAVPPGPGRLELCDVSVRVDERRVLDHLDLRVPAGTSMAVVGRSGAGKSVLTSLIGRLADPDGGEVRLDGVPVSTMDLTALRRTVTYAFERPALLGATVHDMIAYARPDATRAEVTDAACAAQADRFIRRLPHGYDTPLAQAPMSGGELQRLGLARAVVTGARVVVLDDATSSLDTATEMQVAQALQRVFAGRTSLVVAHRAGTAARADLVAWLDGGRIRAVAPHAVLWSDPGYRAVFGVEEAEQGLAEGAGATSASLSAGVRS